MRKTSSRFSKYVFHLVFVCIMMGWVACSTTRRLPEDDQLYIGIDKITYEDTPAIREKKHEEGYDWRHCLDRQCRERG